jgi:DNA-binding NtrC family response regulator
VGGPFQILVVDRNPHVRRFLSRELSAAGFLVSAAENAQRLIEVLSEGNGPDLVVLDPDLPDADSPALLTRLQSRSPAIPVVIHTFLSEFNERAQALDWTAACVEKGANSSDALIREVTRLLSAASPRHRG